jgi:predicted acylesterase/phospholipase RssA
MSKEQHDTEVNFDFGYLTRENAHASYGPPAKDLENHPNYGDVVASFFKNLFRPIAVSKKTDAMTDLLAKIRELGLLGQLKCKQLLIDGWNSDFNDEHLVKIISGISAHADNQIEYLSVKDNNISEVSLTILLNDLCMETSVNRNLLYLDVSPEIEQVPVVKQIRSLLEVRLRDKKLARAMETLVRSEKILGADHPLLIDKYNDVAYLFYVIATSQDPINKDLLINTVVYTEKARDLSEKRFIKNVGFYNENIAYIWVLIGDLVKASMFSNNLNGLKWQSPPRGETPIKILCFDGGGVRGLTEIKMLEYILQIVGPNDDLIDHFDMICGTSTGGMIALGLLKRLKLQDMRELYWKLSTEIFGGTGLSALTNGITKLVSSNGWYSDEKLAECLKSYLGEEPILSVQSKAKVFVACATQNKNTSPNPLLIRNYLNPNSKITSGNIDAKMWECARATTAAPTYFGPITLNGITLIDGGVIHNNPTELAYREALLLWPDRDFLIISLGTGKFTSQEKREISSSWSVVQTVNQLVGVATNAEKTHMTVKETILTTPTTNKCNYFRFNPSGIGHIKLDSYKHQDLNQLEEVASKYMRDKTKKLSKLVELLRPNSDIKEFTRKESEKGTLESRTMVLTIDESKLEELTNAQEGQFKLKEVFFEIYNENTRLKKAIENLKMQISYQQRDFEAIKKLEKISLGGKIVGTLYESGHTEYLVEITRIRLLILNSYTISTRYSDWLTLYDNLNKIGIKPLPPFPEKKLFGSSSEPTVRFRCDCFQNLMNFIHNRFDVRDLQIVQDFFAPQQPRKV